MELEIVPDPSRRRAAMVRVGGADQSYVDLDNPTRLEFDYVQRIADLLDAHRPAGERMRVVHIGGAGMTLPRYVAHTRPTSPQIVLEPDTALLTRVREALPLPRHSGIKVREVDGRAGLAAMPDAYAEVVVIDAFHGRRVPPELTTVEFLGDVSRVLSDTGLVVLNITDQAPFHYTRGVAAGLLATLPRVLLGAEPATLKGRRFGNLVLAGSRGGFDVQALTRRAAAAFFPYRLLGEQALDRFVGHAEPWTDAHASSSPLPPSSRASF